MLREKERKLEQVQMQLLLYAQDLAQMNLQREKAFDSALDVLMAALDLRDTETEGHSRRVAEYTTYLAQQAGLSGNQLAIIERGALLHDIGKIGISDSILRKPGKLTPEEWEQMKQHTLWGYRMVLRMPFLNEEVARIVLHHHERFDGKGYPYGLAGDQICLGARFFAIADTFDAITSNRPYRRAAPYEVARAEIEKGAGSQFDPDIVDVFLQIPEREWTLIRERVSAQYPESIWAWKQSPIYLEAQPAVAAL
ncbi:MAG: HD-GYP domain-containing protein [Abditibacteriales bacterium]|nr:HD-GYP domain-containing protein [Abditibacteriales bacterium]